MPIMFPAPGLFSTKNDCPNAFEKCCASTRPRISVPPAGGDGTTMRTGRAGYSACASAPLANAKRRKNLAHRMQPLSCALDGLRGDEHKGDDARLGSAIHPVVHGAALHENIAPAKAH